MEQNAPLHTPGAATCALILGKIGTNLGKIGMIFGKIRPNSGKIGVNFGRFTLNLGKIGMNVGRIGVICGKIETNLVARTQNDVIRCPTPPPVMMMVMKPRPTLRTFTRWMLTILTVVLVVVWMGSGKFRFDVEVPWYARGNKEWSPLIVMNGSYFATISTDQSDAWTPRTQKWAFYISKSFNLQLWEWKDWAVFNSRVVIFPAWVPPLLVAIPTALLWRKEIIVRRRKPGVCKKCGYDITGLVGKEACPECGKVFATKSAQANAS